MVINETINATVQTGLLGQLVDYPVVQRFVELVGAPYYHQDMLWITAPLIISLFLMQLYFGRYRKEELGWNTAVGNSLALIFVSVDLARYLYTNAASKTFTGILSHNFPKFTLVSVLAVVSMWLLFGQFFHLFPKRLAFLISSSLPTTMLAYLGIVLVYTEVPLDLITLASGGLLFIVLTVFFGIVHILEPFHLTKEEKLNLLRQKYSK